MLRRWEELPEFMRTDAVRPYYKALEKKRYSLYLKRLFDFSMSSVMLILLSPVLLGLGIWIRMDSEGPVFYRQKRITQYGRPFEIYKFRTMVVNADRIGSQVTVGKDPRITRAGSFLRGCRLDELPQLINIWKTLLLPAGVTSMASICYKDEERMLQGVCGEEADRVYVEKILPEKMKWNFIELKKTSIIRDVQVLFKTVAAVI